MVNAWSLAASILNGTFDEDYPMKEEHSDAWYDYKRNDPNAENPFTDPEDRARAERVVGNGNTAGISTDLYSNDELDLNVDFNIDLADIDDMYAHQFNDYDTMDMDFYEPKRAHFYKYHEEDILKDIEEYVSQTYQGHYTGTKHEFRNVQTIDLMASKDLAAAFCQANILKYGSRYGNKDGKNQKDLMKVIHYAMLLLHFDGHYGEPSMPSGNFEQMP
tara:strand:- start:757 stop:1410 length:654 start_codon:yes stop_codon:yes gene_type:complete